MKSSSLISAAGWILVLSGLVHAVIFLATGSSWEGPLSIRKPILFGISTGLTLVSLGWLQSKLLPARYDGVLSRMFAIAMLIEVGLITLQYWRGQASHFNHEDTISWIVDRTITCLIIFATLFIIDLTRRSLKFFDAETEMKLAIRAGMIFLLISCGMGFVILFYGEYLASQGRSPETFGKAGVMKFPHGIAIHAIQLFPILVWVASKLNISSAKRVRIVQYSIASMTAFLVFSLVQTLSGRARFDVDWIGGSCLALAILLIVFVVREFAVASAQRLRDPVKKAHPTL